MPIYHNTCTCTIYIVLIVQAIINDTKKASQYTIIMLLAPTIIMSFYSLKSCAFSVNHEFRARHIFGPKESMSRPGYLDIWAKS